MSSDDLVAALTGLRRAAVKAGAHIVVTNDYPDGVKAFGILCDAIDVADAALAAKPEPTPHHPERAAKPELPPPDGKPGGWDYPGHFDPMTGKDRDR